MSDVTVSFDEMVAQKASADVRHHDRSTIDFPYLDLEAAIEVSKALYDKGGYSSCDLDELAAAMGQTLSGTFRMKTSAARLFGLVEKDGRGKLRLTSTGQLVIQPDTAAEARAAGFLNVELYRTIFEKYRGHLLPPAKALEREMGALGVAPKQTDKARQAFERSAKQAGFYAHGEDRLVAPRFDPHPQTRATSSEEGPTNSHGGGGGGSGPGKPPPGRSVSEVLLAAFDPKDMDDAQQDAVWTLLKYFKTKGM